VAPRKKDGKKEKEAPYIRPEAAPEKNPALGNYVPSSHPKKFAPSWLKKSAPKEKEEKKRENPTPIGTIPWPRGHTPKKKTKIGLLGGTPDEAS